MRQQVLSLPVKSGKMVECFLANLAMHIKLDQQEREQVLQFFKQKHVKKKAVLLTGGDICKNIFYVVKGCLRIYHTDSEGRDHISLFAPDNWWAVDIASFYNQKPAFYTIDALEDTIIYQVSYAELEKLYQQVPKMERFFRILTQNGFAIYQQRVTSAQSQPAEIRYHDFQQRYPKLEQRIAQKHIAAYLGITPVFLSMLRAKK